MFFSTFVYLWRMFSCFARGGFDVLITISSFGILSEDRNLDIHFDSVLFTVYYTPDKVEMPQVIHEVIVTSDEDTMNEHKSYLGVIVNKSSDDPRSTHTLSWMTLFMRGLLDLSFFLNEIG